MGTLATLWQDHRTLMVFFMVLIVVIPFLIFYLSKARKEHPKGLIAAALSNMGERFGYYIMNAVLVLFICSKFGISDEWSALIFGVFYFLIYVLALPGGIIADRTQNYKKTIITGIIVMAVGYGLLSIPVFSANGAKSWVFFLAMFALLLIACGNGLFKGNLQAIVGQLYDDFEAEAAKKGPEALAEAKEKRDNGFQIFYVFINIGGVIAPFVAPIIRDWFLKTKDLVYNADLPRLCHKFIMGTMSGNDMDNLTMLTQNFSGAAENLSNFCQNYLRVYNTGVHLSFIVSVIAMLISLFIFIAVRHKLPNPVKKVKASVQELSIFARDFVDTSALPPEILQFINPFFVIVLTPVIMWLFARLTRKGKEISTPKKIALGMFIAACAYLFLIVVAVVHHYPSGDAFKALEESVKMSMKTTPGVLIVTYFFLTVAELFISPLGLSFVSKIAPRHMVGKCQGLWLTATAIGNLFIFLGVKMLNAFPQQWMTWGVFALICLASMGIMVGMLKWLERVAK